MHKEWTEHWLTGGVNPGKTCEWAITKSPMETGQVVSPQRSCVSLCMCHPKYDTSITSFPPDNALPGSWNAWFRENRENIYPPKPNPSLPELYHYATYTNTQWYQFPSNSQINLLSTLRIYAYKQSTTRVLFSYLAL